VKSGDSDPTRRLSTAHFTLAVLAGACLAWVLTQRPFGSLPSTEGSLRTAGLLFMAATVVYLGLTAAAQSAAGLDWRQTEGRGARTPLSAAAHCAVLCALVIVAARQTQSHVYIIGQERLLPPLFMTSAIAATLAWYGWFITVDEPPTSSPSRSRRILIASSAVAGCVVAVSLAWVEFS
jgi:hypothetical protein